MPMDRYKFPIILDHKMNKLLVGTLFAVACISSHADDLRVADDFKSGDLVSADTFNQIFDTIEKISRTVVDSDLVGVWKCSAVHASSDNYNGWTNKGLVYELTGAQVNFTASSAATSLESAYSYSTSSPTPFFRSSDPAEAGTGKYQFYKGLLVLKNTATTNRGVATVAWNLDIVSDTRFILEKKNASGNMPELVVCDSEEAVPASPTSPTTTNNKTGINLAWTDASSDETGFKVYRKLSTESEAKVIATQAAVTYLDTDLSEGQTAYYHVTAYNDNGESANSKVVSDTLDRVAPAVISHAPVEEQAVKVGTNIVSITFSEKIRVVCPATESFISTAADLNLCASSLSAIQVSGDRDMNHFWKGLTMTNNPTSTLSETDVLWVTPNLDITITVLKDWIEDENGNKMDADYSFTFNTIP